MKAQSEGVTLMRTSLATEPKRLSLDTVEEKAEKLATLSELTHVSTKVYCICYISTFDVRFLSPPFFLANAFVPLLRACLKYQSLKPVQDDGHEQRLHQRVLR